MRTLIIYLFILPGGLVPALWPAVTPAAAAGFNNTVAPESGQDNSRTLALSKKLSAGNATTRIIAGLRIAFTPEGGLTAAAAAQQRNEIARLQSAVLEKVPSLKLKPENIKLFENIPFMAMEVNGAELEALSRLSEIVSIEEDRLASPASGAGLVMPDSK